MRRLLLCGVAIIGMGLEANAADMPDFLRGSSTVIAAPGGPRWDGFYVGGVVGWSVPGVDFTNNMSNLSTLVSTSGGTNVTASALGNNDSTATHFGGFVGYQQQWDGAVVGIEGTYNWIGKSITAVNALSGNFGSPTDQLIFSAAGSATAHIIDYGTIRIKGGWAASSMFMPYATFGLAIGRMDITRAAVITPTATSGTPPGTFVPGPFTVSESLNNQFGYGYAAGLGVDMCLMANLFARVEYEYVQFPDFQGLNAHLHNVRVGAAFKF
ncbi:MAG: outer membrane beta-barrel protein [Alphaproteobacteria bacterium]